MQVVILSVSNAKRASLKLLMGGSIILVLIGLGYIIYLYGIYPSLVPMYGGGEGFILDSYNNYTVDMPWYSDSLLHVFLQANDTVSIYMDGEYLIDSMQEDFIFASGEIVMIGLESESPVTGRFTARQEIPLDKQLYGFFTLSAGLIGGVISFRTWRAPNREEIEA